MSADSSNSSHTTVPWGPSAAIIVSLLLFIGAQIIVYFLVSIVAGLMWNVADAQRWLESINGQFVFVLLSEATIVLILWLFLRRRKGNFKQLGFSRLPVWDDIARALAGFVVYFIALLVIMQLATALTPINTEQCQELGFKNLLGAPEVTMAFISLVVLPPLVEELVFRGFVFTGLRRKLTFVWATLITSVLFAVPHLFASSEGLLWVAGVDTLVLSFILCYLREKTGVLWAAIVLHAMKNGIAFVFYITSTSC